MALLMALALAILVATPQVAPAATAQTPLAPPSATEQTAEPRSRRVVALRDMNEVVCETRAVTGSRFNRRVCQTRRRAGANRDEALAVISDARPGPSTDAILNGPNFRPQ